jgi:tetraprenyl-beta-curcumene synthase
VALSRAAGRELVWGLRAASVEIQRWRTRALVIPDQPMREDALRALATKRTHLHGAALFWTLPRRRNRDLLRLLVAYELIWDFLDNVNERAAAAGTLNGRQLHLAIAEAIDPSVPISNYYRHSNSGADGGFLFSLVETCRDCCLLLPSYARVQERAVSEAHRAEVLALNHHPDPFERDAALRHWVARERLAAPRTNWWELSGAASAPLAIHALLALAAEPICSEKDISGAYAAYFPWLAATTTMLDSYVDQDEDVESGDHSYVAHYQGHEQAVSSIQDLVLRSVIEVRALRNGHRHAVVAAAMIAMYLSKDAARTPALHAGTRILVRSGGSLTRLMLPILRIWRVVFDQRSA